MDRSDALLLLALVREPRGTVLSLAERVGLSRNTVQARLARYESTVLASFDRCLDPSALGYPLTAFISISVEQRHLDPVADALRNIPEILEISGLSGSTDLLARVVARDADDLYRIAGRVLATQGVQRTETSLVMRKMVEYRISPLLERLAAN